MAFISHCCREVKKILHPMVCNSITRKRRQIAKSNLPPQSVEEAGVKREQNTGFFEIEGQKEDEGGGNKADGSPATSV